MHGVLFVIGLIITVCVYISDGQFDNERTYESKANAIRNNAFVYTEYKGNAQHKRMFGHHREVYEMNGYLKEMRTGKILMDLWGAERKDKEKYAIKRAKEMGYDFYPLFIRGNEWKKEYAYNEPVLIEMETGRFFVYKKYVREFNDHRWERCYLVYNKKWKDFEYQKTDAKIFNTVKSDIHYYENDINTIMVKLKTEASKAVHPKYILY